MKRERVKNFLKKDLSETKRVIIFADPKGSKFIELLSEYKGLKNGKINFSKKNPQTLAR